LGGMAGLGQMSPKLVKLQESLRESVPFLSQDAYMAPLLGDALSWIKNNLPEDIDKCH
jgi:histidine ammonia-lyase